MPPLWQPGWTASLFYSTCLYTRDLVSGGICGPSGRPRGPLVSPSKGEALSHFTVVTVVCYQKIPKKRKD